jgi:hypothetical protein
MIAYFMRTAKEFPEEVALSTTPENINSTNSKSADSISPFAESLRLVGKVDQLMALPTKRN